MTVDLETLIEKNVSKLGYELVDFEIINKGELLRIFIDQPNSITIDDCVDVTNQLKHILIVEEDVSFDRLEVSSPGMDRVVKKLNDFERFKGEKIKIKTRIAIENRRNFVGILQGIKKDLILIKLSDASLEIKLDNIEKARLDPEF
ncbi:MAG: ribosome maturation factor RimP [Nitrosomonadales bacterium]|nr:ribosome maturation factor RimP [Nitrosomonadales bacterium]MAS00249.1 ribosome maturation factor RimP [Nitrosomonadales bacterium]|tara:strand:- start:4302 stop:4739 length:438 start_codon:yes stop_codon:yes gene_type:complete